MSLFFPDCLSHRTTFSKILSHVLQDNDNAGNGDIEIQKKSLYDIRCRPCNAT